MSALGEQIVSRLSRAAQDINAYNAQVNRVSSALQSIDVRGGSRRDVEVNLRNQVEKLRTAHERLNDAGGFGETLKSIGRSVANLDQRLTVAEADTRALQKKRNALERRLVSKKKQPEEEAGKLRLEQEPVRRTMKQLKSSDPSTDVLSLHSQDPRLDGGASEYWRESKIVGTSGEVAGILPQAPASSVTSSVTENVAEMSRSLADTIENLDRALHSQNLKHDLYTVGLCLDECLLQLKLWRHDVGLDRDLEIFEYDTQLFIVDSSVLEHIERYTAHVEKMLSGHDAGVRTADQDQLFSTAKLLESLVLSFTEDTSAHRMMKNLDEDVCNLRRVIGTFTPDPRTKGEITGTPGLSRVESGQLESNLLGLNDVSKEELRRAAEDLQGLRRAI